MTPELLTGATPYGIIALVFTYIIKRLGSVENRLQKAEENIRIEQEKNSRLERLLERVCTGYESVRRELLKVAKILRKGGTVSEDHLAELESTPDIKALLTTKVIDE